MANRPANTTISDVARKRGIDDLISHLSTKDNHLWQALQSLQTQSNHLVQNMMDTAAAVNHVAQQTSVALGTTITPSTPGTGGTPGGSTGTGSGGTGSGTTPPVSFPPGFGSAPPDIANFVIQNETATRQPDGSITYEADFSWSNPGAAGSTIFFLGVDLQVTVTTGNETVPFRVGFGQYNGLLGSTQSQHVTRVFGPQTQETWTVSAIPTNTAMQPGIPPYQTRDWVLTPP